MRNVDEPLRSIRVAVACIISILIIMRPVAFMAAEHFHVDLIENDALTALPRLAAEVCADFIFLDPPYKLEHAYRGTLGSLGESPLVKDSTVVIAEHNKKFDPGEDFSPLQRYRRLVQGDAVLSLYRRS